MTIVFVSQLTESSGPWIGLALVVLLAPLAALAMRRLRLPGALLVGGTIVGLALGPAFFGRIAPQTYLRVFEGSPAVVDALVAAERSIGALAVASAGSFTTPDESSHERLSSERDQARKAWLVEKHNHERLFLIAAIVCATLVMATSMGRGARPQRANSHDLVLALWAIVPAALLTLLIAELRGDSLLAPSTVILICACTCGAWSVMREERAITRYCPPNTARTTATVARVTTAIACFFAAPALWMSSHQVLGPTAGVALVVGASAAFLRPPVQLVRVASRFAIPILAALLALRIDPTRDSSPLLLVVLFLVAEDARWLGTLAGRALAGERPMMAMRTAMAGLAVGPTMLAFTALGSAAGALSGPIASSLLFAAILIELLAPARLRVAQRLERTESQTEVDA